LIYVLYGLFVLACLALIAAVLLQPGKADAGALFTNSISSTAFGPRGTQTLLAKITIGAAAAFMLIALILSIPAVTGPRSVLQSEGDAEATASPQPAPSVTITTSSPTTVTVPPTNQEVAAPNANANSNSAAGNTNTANTNATAQPSASVQPSPAASR
jgi:preprotein translocase subunit SecG